LQIRCGRMPPAQRKAQKQSKRFLWRPASA
jgi:hypothetical protein